MKDRVGRALERVRNAPVVSGALWVNAKYNEDDGGYLAAAMTYYGFLSLFPLILVALSAIGFVLAHNETAQAAWTARLAGSVPGLGPLIGQNIDAVVKARAGAGVVGLAGLLWSGTALTNASGYALSRVYRRTEVKGFVRQKVWSAGSTAGLGLLALTGVGVAGAVAGTHASGAAGGALAALTVAVAFVLDVALFCASYRLLTPGSGPPWRQLLPGAMLAAVGWTLLKVAGAWYASRTVAGASQVYGTFGTVVGVMAMLYLASRLFLYGAELNAMLFEAGEARGLTKLTARRAA